MIAASGAAIIASAAHWNYHREEAEGGDWRAGSPENNQEFL
jgi:hypothetical protein